MDWKRLPKNMKRVMSDLEQSIAQWLKQLLAAGIKTPSPLEELENHLREEIERQMKSGLSEQDVFHSAVEKIGQAHVLQSEFSKINRPGIRQLMKNSKFASRSSLAIVLLATVWLAFSAAMIGKDLFINDGLVPLRVSDGALVAVQNGVPILQGEGTVSASEKYQFALIPALAVPFAVLVAFAIIGCRSLLRNRHDEQPSAGLLTGQS